MIGGAVFKNQLPDASKIKFGWRYIIGFCQAIGVGDDPKIRLYNNDELIWQGDVDVSSEVAAEDAGCGGKSDWTLTSDSISVLKEEVVSIPGSTFKNLRWDFENTSRNFHLFVDYIQILPCKHLLFSTL